MGWLADMSYDNQERPDMSQLPPPPPPARPAKPPLHKRRWVQVAALAGVGFLVLGAIVGDDEDESAPEQAAPTTIEVTEAVPAEPIVVETTEAPTTTAAPTTTEPAPTTTVAPTTTAPPTTTEPPAPALSPAQEQAVRAARSYLDMMGFSRQGLIDQLSSEYGNGFSVTDATAAVDSMDVDYNAQAVRSAEGYLDMMGFSCQGLIDQLSSEYGNRYTVEQAAHGARAMGIC